MNGAGGRSRRPSPVAPDGPGNAAHTYEFKVIAASGGWWDVMQSFAYERGSGEMVARVFGERRAEIVRDALSEEANERV